MLGSRSSYRLGVWMFFLLLAAPGLTGAATLELISGTATVSDSFGTSEQPALSADGRYVAFVSDAANLVPGQEDDNNTRDVFLHDRLLGTTTLVSHVPGSPARAAAPGQYNSLEISADGRYVAFSSSSADLTPGAGDNGSNLDVFLWDRITGTTTLVSHPAGTPGTAGDGSSYGVRMNADASFLVVISGARNLVTGQTEPGPNFQTTDIFLWNRASDTMTMVSHRSGTTATAADQSSFTAVISADGGVVVFASAATDLLPSITVVGGSSQIYAYERATGNLSLVSRAATGSHLAVGAQYDSILVSNDGRYVAFSSDAANLVPGQVDTNSTLDAFLYDRTTGEMRLVSHRSSSALLAAGISSSGGLSMSAGGRYVAFASSAPDLVPGQVDPYLSTDVFVWDRNSGLIALASHSRDSFTTAGSPGPTDTSGTSSAPRLSADGRFLVFHSTAVDLVHGVADAAGIVDVFLYDQTTREVTLVSRTRGGAPANWRSYFPILSADGSVAAFISEATDLGEGQTDPYLFRDLFLYERTSGEITSPSLRDPGLPLPLTVRERSLLGNLSADGRFVAFQRDGAYLRDAVADMTARLGAPLSPPYTRETSLNPVLSADGHFAALLSAQSTPGYAEGLFLYDRAAGTYALVNHVPGSATPGSQPDGFPSSYVLSADGRYVAYQCLPCGLVPGHPGTAPNGSGFDEIFLYDRLTGLNTLASHAASSPTARADGHSRLPAISADGRYVAFWSDATNLVPGQIDTPGSFDLFVFDREAGPTGSIELATHVPGSPTTAAGHSDLSFAAPLHLSADGRFIAFQSALPNLVPGQVDTNQNIDVFLRDRTAGTTVLVSHAASSAVTAGNRPSQSLTHEDPVSMSADGRFVVYESSATDLVAGAVDTNGARDVFLYDRQSGTVSLVSHAGADSLKAGNGESESPRVSADGSTIAFLSGATDLDPKRNIQHAFSYSRSLYAQYRDQSGSTGTTAFIAEALKAGRPFNLFPVEEAPIYLAPQLSADGRRIAFTSDSALVLGDYNRTWDVYLWEGTVAEPEDPEDPEDPDGPVTLSPCRLLDTRRRAERPILTSNVQRTVTAHGRCGVPATAKQVLVKVTVFNPSGKGNLRFYPGAATGAPSAILRFERGFIRTEVFTLPLSPNGTLTVLPFVAGRGTVHGVVEVTGYEN